MAQKLGKLKCLERFLYCDMDADSEEAIRFAGVLKANEHWDETSRRFAEHCPVMDFLSLCKCTVDRACRIMTLNCP